MKKPLPSFLAIDFETADYGRDSACAVGLVRVEEGEIVARSTRLIRPPRRQMLFTHIHGITWNDVKSEPTFAFVWHDIAPLFRDVDFLAAHNASFDRGVLHACCSAAGIIPPGQPFECTMRLSRKIWKITPTTLDSVCREFDIPLDHHNAESDTHACATIMIRALRETGTHQLKHTYADH